MDAMGAGMGALSVESGHPLMMKLLSEMLPQTGTLSLVQLCCSLPRSTASLCWHTSESIEAECVGKSMALRKMQQFVLFFSKASKTSASYAQMIIGHGLPQLQLWVLDLWQC